MKKLLSLILILSMIASMFVLPVSALEPIAEVTNNGKTTDIYSLDDFIQTILPDGNTEITLLQDLEVTGKQALLSPYSFTLDLNGFTLSADEDAIRIAASGYRTPVAVIKNGVIRTGGIGVRVDNGGLRMENVTVYAHGNSPAVAFYEIRDEYSDDNIFVGCTLVSANNSVISFDHPTEKQTGVGVTVKDTRLIAALQSGHTVVTANSGGGFVCSEAGTEFYTYNEWTFGANAGTSSIGNTTIEKGVCDITVDELGLSLNSINKWIYRDNGSDIMTLSVLQTEGGTVTLPKYTAAAGEIITATITPDPGMVFKYMVGSGTNHTATFVVPNHSPAEVTLIPVFASATEHTGEVVAVTTNGTTRISTGIAALPGMIDASGRSTVTLLADITVNATINLPYSCTIDLNGHTLRNSDGNILTVSGVGSDNSVTLIKNGTIDSSHLAVNVRKGALQMERVTVRGEDYAAVCLGETDSKYNSNNLITDCTLYSAGLSVFQFQNVNDSPTGVSMKLQNTKLVSTGEYTLLLSSLNSIAGEIVELGENVDFYSTDLSSINTSRVILQGGALKKSSATVDLDIAELGIRHTGIHHWYVQEAAEPIASIVTGNRTVYPNSLEELVSAIDPSGNSVVTLYKDVERTVTTGTGQIILPYTCEIDLNGHTWSNINSASGNAIKFADVGSQNSHAIVKNGTVLGASVCISADKGSVEVRNCTLYSPKSIGVSIYVANAAFNAKNLIEGCTILTGGTNGTFSFQGASPMNGAKMTIRNSTLAQFNGTGYVLNNKAGGSCTVELGENVHLYALSEDLIVAPGITVTGLARKAVAGSHTVSAAGYSHSGLMKWSTVEGSGETPSSGALATVTTNGSTVNVNTVEELVAAISPTGNSVVKLLRNLEHTVPAGSSGQILISYPCTIDLNGYTWSNAQCTKGNAMSIAATSVGTENSHTVVKNGTIIGATMGIRHTYGSLEVQNCTVIAPTSVAIGLYGTATAVTARNRIDGCTLVAGGNGAYSWHADGVSQANMKMTIVDTTLVQTNPDISAVNTRNSGAYVAFGENVDIYSAGTAINSNVILNGFALLSESGTHSITVNGQTYSGLKKWISSNTPTVDPPSNAIATITTDGTTVNVNTVTELTAAVSRTGNSQVKLLKDITHSSAIIFPYVCTVDFNGHTVTTNLTTGNGMEFQQIGSANHTAVVKNGKLKHYELGIRLTKGSLRVENMVIDSMNGACIGVYDDTTTRHVTVVDSQLSSKNYGCFSFNKANTDLSNFIFIVKNSTLVSYKNQSGSYSAVISRNGSGTLPGNIVFGEGVELYSYYNTFNSRPFSETVYTRVYGEPLTLASGTHSVTVNGQTFSGLRKWTTPTTATKSAVAAVTNGSETAYPTTLEEILTLVQPDGLTKIKMLADVERKITTTGESGQIILPYTCEIDLNGHTWSNVNSNSGNAMKFSNVGTQNYHAVVKNGTILAASVGVSSMFGSLEVRNCAIVSPKSIGVSLYSTATAFNSKNLIEGCTILAGGANGAFSFQGESPMDGVQMRIVNSTLAQVNGTGYTLNSKAGGAGIVELGEKVSLYAVNDSMLKHSAILLAGEVLTAQSGTHTVSAAGYSFSNLKKWSTPEFPSNVIATVTTGGNTVNVTSVSALQNAISATGNSVVKLVKNITYTASSIQLPYSCTLDFNGYTIRTNTASGNCIQVLHAGSENPVTTLKNGTMVYHTVGVRVDGGAIVVSNMTMHGLSGVAVGIYDTSAAYKALNRIENSTLIGTEWGVVSFNKTNTNFSSTGIAVENSTLVSLKPEGSHVFVRQNGTTGGTVTLGEGVKLYSYRDTGYAQSALPVEGIVLEKAAEPATFTHEDLGLNHSGLTLWQSKTGVTGISILFTKPANGTIYVPSLAEPGSTVTVTAVPDEGYEFSHLLVNGQVVNGLTFTAPQSGTVNLSGVFEEPQRTVIATVTTGDISLDVTTLEDLIAAVDPSGLSVITLLSDVERVVIGSSGQIVLPYSCTVDLNGFTWSNVRSTSGNALKIDGIGSVNTHSVVKNGTILAASVGVSCTEGSLEVRNCTIVSPASVGVSIYTTNPAYNEKNLIDGCTILAGGRGAFSYHLSTAAQPGIKMVIRNSTLAQVNGENCTLNALVGGGDLYLGSNVALYSLSEATLVHDSITLLGKSLTAQSGTHSVSAAGYSYSGLKKWSTPEGVTATFSQATIPNGALGWVAAYDAQQRMISMSTVESVCGVLSVDLPTEIAESAADIKLFILQNGALSPVQAPVDADSEVPAPEQPDADAPWKDISRRDAENFVTKLFGEEGATVALSLRCPKEWHFSTSPGDGLTISRFDSYSNELEFGKAVAGNDGSDANWTAVATRTLLLSNMLTHEFVEQNGSEYRVRLVYENASKTDCISITLPLTECGENIRNNLYLNSSLLTTVTDPGMGTLSALQGEKLLLLGNSFIGSSEIGTHLNRMFADNSKGATATPVSVGYATVQTFASDSARMDTIRSGEYGAVFLCGLYSGSEVAYIETIRAACETGGAQLILLPAHNESRTAILQASKTYPDIPILDWKAEIDTFLAAGQDKWDFCINDAHLHSTPLAGYVGAHMIYRAIYEECPIASAGSVTEFEMWAILADYIETGVVQLIDPADIFPIL